MLETAALSLAVLVCIGSACRLLARRHRLMRGPAADAESHPQIRGLRRQLRVLQLDIEPLMFLCCIGTVCVLVFLIFIELFPERPGLALLAGCSPLPLTLYLIRDLVAWRGRHFESALSDAIDLIQTALLGGESPRRALMIAAEGSDGRVREELREVVRRLNCGLPIDGATVRMGVLYDTEGVRLFVQALNAKWQSEADFGALLGAIGRILRERLKLRMLTAGQLSGARYAALIAGLLPYLLIPVFLWKEPEWLDLLITHQIGPSLLLGAVICQVTGFFWLRAVLRTEL